MSEDYIKFRKFKAGDLYDQFIVACSNGLLDMVRFLLTDLELEGRQNIHAQSDEGFRKACQYGHLNVVQYLLANPELKEHADIHACNDWGFTWACYNNHLDVIHFLIFDMNIEKSSEIESHLTKFPNDVVESMFRVRDLDEKLKIELNSDKKNNRNIKI